MAERATARICPKLGYGLRLQREFIKPLLGAEFGVDWLEIISDGWLEAGPTELEPLERLADRYPLVLHGMSLAIGGEGPLDAGYLERLRILAERLRTPWISDHLCCSGQGGGKDQELAPLPRTRSSLERLLPRIREVQGRLERPLLLENIPPGKDAGDGGTLDQWEFIAEVAERSDSLILLDLDNLYLSAIASGRDPLDLLDRLPAERIWQLHLGSRPEAGDQPAATNPVWALFLAALPRLAPVNVMLEPSNSLPPLAELALELGELRRLAAPPGP